MNTVPAHKRLYKDEAWLRQRYIVDKLSIRRLADTEKVSRSVIRHWLQVYGLAKQRVPCLCPQRGKPKYSTSTLRTFCRKESYRGQKHHAWKHGLGNKTGKCLDCGAPIIKIATYCQKHAYVGVRHPRYKSGLFKDRGWLYSKYVSEGLPASKLAALENVSTGAILTQLHRHSIPVRCGAPKRIQGKIQDKEWLYAEYITDRKGIRLIARTLGVAHATVREYLIKFGIPIRARKPIIDVHEQVRYWSKKYWAPSVLTGDEHTCCFCKTKLSLQAHHVVQLSKIIDRVVEGNKRINLSTVLGRRELSSLIIADKQFRDVENGITLCNACHSLVHGFKVLSCRPKNAVA